MSCAAPLSGGISRWFSFSSLPVALLANEDGDWVPLGSGLLEDFSLVFRGDLFSAEEAEDASVFGTIGIDGPFAGTGDPHWDVFVVSVRVHCFERL